MATPPHDLGLGADLCAWVEGATGGRIVAVERIARWRPSWFVSVTTATGTRELVVKSPRAPLAVVERSHALRELSVQREARVLSFLHDHDIPVPPCVAYDADTGSVLMERMPGTAILQSVPVPERATPVEEYAAVLARVHGLDPAPLGLVAPEGPDALAFAGLLELGLADYEQTKPRLHLPEPMPEWALAWLRRNVPRRERAVLVQGDCGPNQFLFHGGHLSAVIDWELAHLGDPLVDLAGFRLREVMYPSGVADRFFDRYARESGEPIDGRALAFYTVLVNLFSVFGLVATVQRPKASHTETAQRLWFDAAHRMMVLEAIAEHDGRPPVLLDDLPDDATPRSHLATHLVERVRARHLDTARSPHERFEALATYALTEVLRRAERMGPAMDRATLDDLATVLGRRPADVPSGMRQLAARLEAESTWRFDDVLWLFSRAARRSLALYEPLRCTTYWDLETDPVFPAAVAPDALCPLLAPTSGATRPTT